MLGEPVNLLTATLPVVASVVFFRGSIGVAPGDDVAPEEVPSAGGGGVDLHP